MFKKILTFLLATLFFLPAFAHKSSAANTLDLYTPYTGISVTPGNAITYNVSLLNHSGSIQDVHFSLSGLPKGWKTTLTSGGYDIQQLAVKGNNSEDLTLTVNVPLKVDKGTYHFQLLAENNQAKAALPLSVTVSKKGTFKSELKVDQPNMEGHNKDSFDFTASLNNRTADTQRYALTANPPSGWDVSYKVDGKSVTSVKLDANTSKDVDINIQPSSNVKAGTYKIPVKAASGSTSANTTLEVVITGTYGIKLTTPSGKVSTNVTAGHTKTVTLTIKNTGSATLRNIKLNADTPADWTVNFSQPTIQKIEPGKSTQVNATIKSAKDAIAGDYVVDMSAQSPNATSDVSFRTTVKTSTLWGWIGVIIILLVIGGIYYLFRTYGRR